MTYDRVLEEMIKVLDKYIVDSNEMLAEGKSEAFVVGFLQGSIKQTSKVLKDRKNRNEGIA
jgi:hypothetical protein